jgi:hypothetical protein
MMLMFMTGCKKKNETVSYGNANRTIKVNNLKQSISLKNVRFYDYYYNRKINSLSGEGYLHSKIGTGSQELMIAMRGNTYIAKINSSSTQIKVNYKKGNYYDTYKKK